VAVLRKGVQPEDCEVLAAAGDHYGMWYYLLYYEGQERPDNATHEFQCHHCEYKKRGRPNDAVGSEVPARPEEA
jgi:hypothetical protein